MGRPYNGIAVVASLLSLGDYNGCSELRHPDMQQPADFTTWNCRTYHHQALVLWPQPLRHRVVCSSVKTAVAFLEEATSQACAARRLHELSASAPRSGASAVLQHANAPASVQLPGPASPSHASARAAATTLDEACELAAMIWRKLDTALVKGPHAPGSVCVQYFRLIEQLQLRLLGLEIVDRLQVRTAAPCCH